MRFRDGFGVRVAASDQAGDAVEHLLLIPELAMQESALRDRVGRLVNFRHAKYVRLRGVDRAKSGTRDLVVSYDTIEGDRLSTILDATSKLHLTLEIDVALQLVRDLLPGIGILHDSRKVTHGAIAPERLVLTTQNRLVIVDHGFGAALGRLNLPRKKFWDQFRIASPPTTKVVFDEQTDVVQIGIVALSLLLGRPLADDDYPAQLKRLIFGVKEASSKVGSRPMSPELRHWLEKALALDEEHAYRTVREAQDAFEAVVAGSRYTPSAAAVKTFLVKYRAAAAKAGEAAAAPSGARISGRSSSTTVDRALEELSVSITARRAPASQSRSGSGADDGAPEAAPALAARAPGASEKRPKSADAAAPGADASERSGDGSRKSRGRLDALQALEEELSRLASLDVVVPTPPASEVLGAASPSAEAVVPVDARQGSPSAGDEANATAVDEPTSVIAKRTGRRPFLGGAIDEELSRLMGDRDPDECATPTFALDAASGTLRPAGGGAELTAFEQEADGIYDDAEAHLSARDVPAAPAVAERAAAEEAARGAAARAAAEREACKAAERQAREASERAAKESAERARAEQAARDAAAHAAAEREARELAQRQAYEAAERAARETAEREAAERAARESAAREMAAREAREAAERQVRETTERAARETAAREAAEREARAEAERQARAAADRRAREQAEREAADREARAAAEREAKEAAARAARDAADREAAEQAAREAAALAAASREARTEAERQAREAADRAVREAADRTRAEQIAREAAARAAAAREARELAERQARAAADEAQREGAAREALQLEAREAAQRARRESAERESAELAAREATARADAECAARALAEQHAREASQRAAREATDRAAAEQIARDASARAAADREAREFAEQETRDAEARSNEDVASLESVLDRTRRKGRKAKRKLARLLEAAADTGVPAEPAAVVPDAEAPVVAAETSGPSFYEWDPGVAVEAVPAWMRGKESDRAEDAPEFEELAADRSFAPAAATGVQSVPHAVVLSFPPPAPAHPTPSSFRAASEALPASDKLAALAGTTVRKGPRFSVNWGRTLAASLLLALLESVAFAAAWWMVTPNELGWLIVHTRPTGINVSIDGKPHGQTPFATGLEPGRHTIELREGTATRVVPVEISAGVQTEQRIAWSRGFRTGQARITSTAQGAWVRLDGKPYGKTPLTISELTAGRHEVAVESDFGSATATLIIEAGETTELEVPVFSGWVTVLSPVDLEIRENGKLLGTTQAEKLMLTPGVHKLEFSNASLGYRGGQDVRVRPGATTSVSVLPQAPVAIEAPEGTVVSIDGERIGEVPLEPLLVSIGTREFVLKHKDEAERRQVVVVTMAAPVVVRY